MSSFFSQTPKIKTDIFSVDGALQLPAFKAIWEASRNTSSSNNTNWDENRKAEWRNLVREGVINVGGESVDINFFNEMYGGNIETIDALNLYTKYNADVDYNIAAAASVTGSAPAAEKWVTLARHYHSTSGTQSYITKGQSVYIYEDGQMCYVKDVDRTTDFAHQFLLQPYRKNYTVNIRKNAAILVIPARIINGQSSPIDSTTMQTPGYVSKVSPLRIRKDWKTPVSLLKGYKDILQWAIMFDKDGNEVDCWITYDKMKAFEQMQLAENLMFFLGNTIDNPALLDVVVDDYSGFDGLLPTLKYAGGFVYNYDPTLGFSLEFDYGTILLRQDSLKETKEFTVMHGKNFMVNMVRNSNNFINNSQPGNLNYNAFSQSVSDSGTMVKKYSIKSYEAFNHSLHFREFGSLSDSRLLGNYDMPNLAICIASGPGLKDSKGKSVTPMEFFVPQGCSETGAFEEYQNDSRTQESRTEYITGWMAKTLMMQIHGAKKHMLFNPVVNC